MMKEEERLKAKENMEKDIQQLIDAGITNEYIIEKVKEMCK